MGTSLTAAAHSPLPSFHHQLSLGNRQRSNLDPIGIHGENYWHQQVRNSQERIYITESREHEQEKATPISAGVNQDRYRFTTDKAGERRQKRIKVSLFNQLRCKHNLLTALGHRKARTWPGCCNRDVPYPPTATAARAVRTQKGSKGRKNLICSWF